MANPTILNYQIQDDQGVKGRTFLYLAYDGATLNVDGLIGAWEAYGGKIDACIDGQILGGHVQIPLEPNVAWKAAPAAGNNVNQLMGIQFSNDFNQYLTTFYLPSYKEALLDANLKPDPTDPAIVALVTDFLSGTPTGGPFTNFANSRDLHDLDADIAYFLTTRKARNNRLITRVIP